MCNQKDEIYNAAIVEGARKQIDDQINILQCLVQEERAAKVRAEGLVKMLRDHIGCLKDDLLLMTANYESLKMISNEDIQEPHALNQEKRA